MYHVTLPLINYTFLFVGFRDQRHAVLGLESPIFILEETTPPSSTSLIPSSSTTSSTRRTSTSSTTPPQVLMEGKFIQAEKKSRKITLPMANRFSALESTSGTLNMGQCSKVTPQRKLRVNVKLHPRVLPRSSWKSGGND